MSTRVAIGTRWQWRRASPYTTKDPFTVLEVRRDGEWCMCRYDGDRDDRAVRVRVRHIEAEADHLAAPHPQTATDPGETKGGR